MGLKENKILLLTIVSLLVIVNVSGVFALSGAIGNSVMIVNTEVNGQDTIEIEKTILVLNRNDETINVTLVADEDAEDFIELIDDNFLLEPNKNKKAEFIIRVKNEDTYNGRINIVFKSADPESKEAGVVLTSKITVIADDPSTTDDSDDGDDSTDDGEDTEDNEDTEDDSDDDSNSGSKSKKSKNDELSYDLSNSNSDNDDSSGMTGGVIGVEGKKSKSGIIFLSVSTVILAVILGALFYKMNSKTKSKTRKKRNGKKGERKRVELNSALDETNEI